MVHVSVPKGSRFQAWAALFVFSCVCLAALTSVDYANTSARKWVLSALSISLIFSFAGVVAYCVPSIKTQFASEKPEGGLALFLLIFWCAALPTIMNPSRALAMASFGIINSNLYFFSWISFICILFIFGDYLQEATKREFGKGVTPKHAKWAGLLAASVVVLASASQIFSDARCTNFNSSGCQRTAYAIAIGVLGMVIPAVALALTHLGKITFVVESSISVVLFILYIFGVGFVTFGTGPATAVGNLYFSMWIGFSISFFIVSDCLHEYLDASGRGSAADGGEEHAPAPVLEDIEQTGGGATEGIEVTK